MSGKSKQKSTPMQQEYQALAKKQEPKRPVLKNSIKAFLVGGIICTVGQGCQWFYMNSLDYNKTTATNLTVATLIIIAVILTGLGLYDYIAQWGGGGSIVPVTGFANTMASAAMDHRSEGFVLGVGGNMFKIAGPVITFGVFSAFVIGVVAVILKSLGSL